MTRFTPICICFCVALLAEGVDRNVKVRHIIARVRASPSSRRAWIEIFDSTFFRGPVGVALLAEGVDRNGLLVDCLVKPEQSPSSRRAWIEIQPDTSSHCAAPVALLAEGVDRNKEINALFNNIRSRPPRGGRG